MNPDNARAPKDKVDVSVPISNPDATTPQSVPVVRPPDLSPWLGEGVGGKPDTVKFPEANQPQKP